jgi:hypothetical protein
MKKLIIILMVATIFSCEDVREHNADADQKFNRKVGGQISLETAERWISRFRSVAGREESFAVSSASVAALLSGVENKLGIVLHHATHDDGAHHILMIAVKDDLLLWTNGPVLDATTDQFVNESTANVWAERYKEANPSAAWSHFFGADTFEEINATPGFTQMEIVPALNDEGKPQLLLYVWSESLSGGKMKNETLQVYDMSWVCPPTCNGQMQ